SKMGRACSTPTVVLIPKTLKHPPVPVAHALMRAAPRLISALVGRCYVQAHHARVRAPRFTPHAADRGGAGFLLMRKEKPARLPAHVAQKLPGRVRME